MRRSLFLALLLAGCAGVEGDIQRTDMREFFLNFVYGKDRGAGYYARQIEKSAIKPEGGRYQYVAPAHISHYLINKSVQGLGGTKLDNSDYLAFVTDRLFFVLRYDPTAAVRATACQSLGRVVVGLPVGAGAPEPKDNRADQRIHTFAEDLRKYSEAVKKGEKVKQSQVVERMRKLAEERPPTARSAMQMVRALAAAPVAGAPPGLIRDASEEIVPTLVRDAILVVLRETAMGDPIRVELEPDESPLVRGEAVDVLARVESPVALGAAQARLADQLDPAERDPDVRSKLVAYLGAVGGPQAFQLCLERLDDVDSDVRFHAYRALMRMTKARVRPTPEAWEAWRESHPAWQLPKKPASKPA